MPSAAVAYGARERVVEPVLAQLRVAAQAEEARPARRNPREHDVIARRDRRHLRAGREHDARAFVSEHGRQRVRDRAVLDRQVGVAHAARGDVHVHVVRAERAEAEILDRERRRRRRAAPPPSRRTGGGNRRCRFSVWRMPGENEIVVSGASS